MFRKKAKEVFKGLRFLKSRQEGIWLLGAYTWPWTFCRNEIEQTAAACWNALLIQCLLDGLCSLWQSDVHIRNQKELKYVYLRVISNSWSEVFIIITKTITLFDKWCWHYLPGYKIIINSSNNNTDLYSTFAIKESKQLCKSSQCCRHLHL